MQCAPDGGGGDVSVAVQRLARRPHMLLPQLQLLLDGVNHAAPPGVHAEVLKRELEVWDVGTHALEAQHLHAGSKQGQEQGQGRVGQSRAGMRAPAPANTRLTTLASKAAVPINSLIVVG